MNASHGVGRSLLRPAVLALNLLALAAIGPAAHATMYQQASIFKFPGGTGEAVSMTGTGPVDVAISFPGYAAQVSVGPYGDYGMQGHQTGAQAMSTEVYIYSDDNINHGGMPADAVTRFVIDGGRLSMVAGQGSVLEYALQLDVGGGPPNGTPPIPPSRVFASYGTLQIDASGQPVFTTSGADIGAYLDLSNPYLPPAVVIPMSFQEVQLGSVLPGQRLPIGYSMKITATPVNFVEVIDWQFSDPLSTGINDPAVLFPARATFAPPAAVPVPPAALLLIGPLLALGAGRREPGGTRGRYARSRRL